LRSASEPPLMRCSSKPADLAALLSEYYQSPPVRRCMIEFLRGTDLETTAVYISGHDGCSEFAEIASPLKLPDCLEAGLEIDRSLWDRDSLLAHIDLEAHNFDNPASAWLDPERALRLQQPVLDATLRILGATGISPLILLSGRGFHLVWTVNRGSGAFRRLADLGYVPASLQARYAQPCSPGGSSVDPETGRAFAALGLVMEFLWHRFLAWGEISGGVSLQPVAIEVGPGENGREIISFDLSEYGDPLHTRQIRVPFSAYLKPRQFEWLLGEEGIRRLLPMFEIPLSGMKLPQAIAIARDPEAAVELARHSSVKIPDSSEGMDNLLDAYQNSPLHAVHSRFYGELERLASLPAPSCPIAGTPHCLQTILEHPNDILLKPAALQHVVRVLMSLGWQAASIAQLISAVYSEDYEWGGIWTRLDPSNRAIFYTRLFAGMICTGADKLIDFNCVSHREKGYCTAQECHSNLAVYREKLIEMRRH
jgi:hypothetical protein